MSNGLITRRRNWQQMYSGTRPHGDLGGIGVRPAQPPMRIMPPEPVPVYCPNCQRLEPIRIGRFGIDLFRRQVTLDGQAVGHFTMVEFDFLWAVARWRGGVVPYRAVFEAVWPGEDWNAVPGRWNMHRLRVNGTRIRRALEAAGLDRHIELATCRQVGYALRTVEP